ncbi:MAG: phage tail-collar fiber domain-containing protein [Hafnia alvei]|uniref:phage tail-collar fiber domain-containing protein n=1 Tax=Hafnia alvei TaxID=569 RepID=UPI003F92C3F7
MSQTTITLAFEQWKAQQAIDGKAVVLDEFVLANVPNLDIDSPIDRAEQLPAAQHIVHRQAVSATGLVNENAVVYSVTMGTEVGDFSFNWVGLINKATGTLAMIVHAPLQSKIKNAEGKQGNVLTRSFLMEYNGAASETQITTPAETWQIDFTARLSGMDERQRLENVDLYGVAAFFGDGFLVTRAASQYSITQGIGYVGGLRCQLPATQNITVTTKPVKVWADVCWKGTLTSVWDAVLKITVADKLANYVQDGVQHYVFAVANIDASGVITDLRPKGALSDQQANDALKKHEQSRNHPDGTVNAKGFVQLSSATNSSSETLAATPKAVKAAYDKALDADEHAQTADNNAGKANDNANTRLEKNKNLSDLSDKPLARKNLALGTAATSNVQKSATDGTANALMANGAWGLGGSTTPVDFASIVPSGFVQGAGNSPIPGTVHFGINIRHQDSYALQFVGRNNRFFAQTVEDKNFRGWAELFTSANKPTANDVDAWPIAVRGNIGNDTLMSTANQVGVYIVSISKPETVADFPKIGNTPLYGYGFMIVTKNGASINQLYMSHRGHIANRQSWNNETGYVNGWNIGYGTINKPTSSDVGALPIGGGTLNGNLIVNNQIQVGGVGTGIINIGDNDSGLRSSKDGQVDLYANGAFRGYWNTTTLGFTGQIIPTNYNNFDARYIQNTQMGAEEYVDIPYPGQANLPWGACPTAYVGTTKSTGSGISFHISRVYFRRIQKYIGGSWKNIA